MPRVTLSVLDQRVGLTFDDPEVGGLLEVAYGHLASSDEPGELRFEIESLRKNPGDEITRLVRWTGGQGFRADDSGEFLVELEAAVTIALQKRRQDLYFLHAAVLERNGVAIALAGRPGAGKSTTCWALLHRGFRYLSDELGPVDVESGFVHSYARSLVLKRDPPAPFDVPAGALRTSRTITIPVDRLPSPAADAPLPLAAVVLLDYQGVGHEVSLERVSPACAGAHLYTHALNALAHPAEGLDAAIQIARRTPCYELVSSDLEQSCSLIDAVCA